MRTVKLDAAEGRNYEPAFRAAVAVQPDDDYRIVMEFFIDEKLSETWTWTPAMTGYVEQEFEGTVKRFQIAWARKSAVSLVKVWSEDTADGARWIVRWANAAGEVQDSVLNAKDEADARDEAEGFVFRMAYM